MTPPSPARTHIPASRSPLRYQYNASSDRRVERRYGVSIKGYLAFDLLARIVVSDQSLYLHHEIIIQV